MRIFSFWNLFAYDSKGGLWSKCEIHCKIFDASDYYAGRGPYHYAFGFTISRFEVGERVCDSF